MVAQQVLTQLTTKQRHKSRVMLPQTYLDSMGRASQAHPWGPSASVRMMWFLHERTHDDQEIGFWRRNCCWTKSCHEHNATTASKPDPRRSQRNACAGYGANERTT